MKDYNEFDGLVHKGGKLFELDGTVVQPRLDSFVQMNGIEVADRNAEEDEKMELAFMAKQSADHKKQQQRLL